MTGALAVKPPDHSPASLGLTSAEAQNRAQSTGANAVADVSTHPITQAFAKFWAPVPEGEKSARGPRVSRSADCSDEEFWGDAGRTRGLTTQVAARAI